MAVGSFNPHSVKAETYNFGTGAWKTVSDYPFGSRVYSYAMVYIPAKSSYFVIGGSDGIGLTQIARLTNGVWSYAGQLNSGRAVSFVCFFLSSIINLSLLIILMQL